MRVLFIVPFPLGRAASQRYRVEQYLPVLQQQGIQYKLRPFWSSSSWEVLYKQGNHTSKLVGLVSGMLTRFLDILKVPSYDYVFIHREATPLGPPWFEWIVSNILKKKIIYDFDDAIWVNNTSEENRLAKRLKLAGKTAFICKWSYKVSVGNTYLYKFAKQHAKLVELLPSVVELEKRYNAIKDQHTPNVAIGWVGSHSTIPYLYQLESVLNKLEEKYAFELIVIADREPRLKLKKVTYLPWSEETEINDLLRINIGLMPLPDDEWTKGKCGFKAIQYMALGIPAVVSAVGANNEVVQDGITGFACSTSKEWYDRLELLLQDASLREIMGAAGVKRVADKYSLKAHQQSFLKLFD